MGQTASRSAAVDEQKENHQSSASQQMKRGGSRDERRSTRSHGRYRHTDERTWQTVESQPMWREAAARHRLLPNRHNGSNNTASGV